MKRKKEEYQAREEFYKNMKSNTTMVKSGIGNLIALCNIIDDFEEFNAATIDFMKSINFERIKIYDLYCVADGQKKWLPRKAIKFYKNNKKVIDTIKKYTYLIKFFENYLRLENDINGNNNYYCFYEYICKHRRDLGRILLLLDRIKKLGFFDITFDEGKDFLQEEYFVSSNPSDNKKIVLLDNMVPSNPCIEDQIRYKTTDSNYEITIDFSDDYRKKIVVNSLLFNLDRLPKEIDEEDIFLKIMNLKNQSNDSSSQISGAEKKITPDIINQEARTQLLYIYYDLKKSLKDLETILFGQEKKVKI